MIRRLSKRLHTATIVTASLLAVSTGGVAHADPGPTSAGTTRQLGLVGAGEEAAARAGNLRRPALPDEPTATDARKRAQQLGAKSYRDESGMRPMRVGLITPPTAPDETFVQECRNDPDASTYTGKVWNRFLWCQQLEAYYYLYDKSGKVIGSLDMTMDLLAYGRDDGQREVEIFMRPHKVFQTGTYTLLSRFTFEVDCEHDTPGCGILGPPVTKTVAQWSADAGSGSWTSYWVTSNEDVSTITDKVLFHPFVFKATYQDGGTALSSDHFIRCDSADYFAGRPKACVMWDVVPHLQYRINNTDGTPTDVHGVAEHIKFAFEHPNDTYPRIPGRDKRIPGRYVGNLDNNYLERVPYNSPDRLANSAEKDRACQRTAPYQDTGLPQPPGPGEQCDEFPFASTKQGAASPDWDFSVRAVPTGDNGKAGIALRMYYNDDRILYYDNDFFYVEIKDS